LHKTFQLQRYCSSCKEFKHKISIENATRRTSATRKNQKDLQQNFAVVELARKQEEEEEEEENKETKEEEEEEEEEYCYLPPSQVHTPPRCIPQEPSRH
jgi:CO dehydrogenase/acetyl-CoA synthase beta subunit